ncbi:MAG: GNAT family N-acetyltransferase [Thermotogota bacterium]
MEAISIKEGGIELLSEIQETWEMLNKHHQEKSINFKERFANFKFNEREKELIKKTEEGEILVLVSYVGNKKAGHCVSTHNKNGKGIIETLYIKNSFRKYGLGKLMMEKSLNWLKNNQVNNIDILVAAGNEEVLPFYERFGFKNAGIKVKKII